MPRGHLETFDRRLFAEFLADSGKTRNAVAAQCGVGKATIAHWLSGRSKPSPLVTPRLAAALGVGVLELSGKTLAIADLVDLRFIHGLTAREAAQCAGLKASHLQTLEEAVTMPRQDHLDALAPVYQVSVAQVRRSWVNRRVWRFGTASFSQLDSPTQSYLGQLLNR